MSKGPVLLAQPYFLAHDPKQVRKMRPYPPLATLITASVLREAGKEVALFDAMLSPGEEEFAAMVSSTRPAIVGLLEDNFNFLTKMCTTRRREASLQMISDAKASGARVAVNGSDAADAPDLYIGAGADAVLLGETDRTFLELVERWEKDPLAELSDIPGLALPARAVGAFAPAVRTAPRPFVAGPRRPPLPRLGPRRPGKVPGGVDRGARAAFLERRDDARLPVPLQLVRQARLRHALRTAQPGERGRGDGEAEGDGAARTTSGSPTTSSAFRTAGSNASPRSSPSGTR